MPIVKTAGPSPASATRSHAPSSTQRRRIAPRGQEDENVDIASPTPTRPLKTQTSAQALTEHVLNNSPGRTPKARGPPKAPRVDRNDGLRHMTEAEMAASYYFARQIGCGNWASVWIVQPKGSARGQVKAMKIVHRASQSGALQRFNALLNEYKVLAGMPRHPNIVCFEDLVLSPSYACLVMPFYDQPMTVCLPFAACRVYFARMAEAVEWLHKHYITHNDLKLANTLVNRGAGEPYGQPVLVDFGFARNHQPCYGTNFISNESWGTPEYLSPERSVGDAHDERLSDIWALGVSFFEMATGRTPFEKKNEVFTTPEAREEYYRRTIQGKWYTDYDLPFEIEDLCRAIVRVDPQARPRIPEILEHDFFQDAAATDSAGSSPRSIDAALDGIDVLDQSILDEIAAECSPVGCRLTYGESRAEAEQANNDSQEHDTSQSRDESSVPFPISPSPVTGAPPAATPASPGSPQLGDHSFETSDLMDDVAPWSKPISSDATRSLLEAVESPSRGRAAATTESKHKPANASDSGIRPPHTTPRRYVVFRGPAVPAETPTQPRKPVESSRSLVSKAGSTLRPGAPTPSRFRSSATANSIVLPSPGASPVRYVGSRAQETNQRSLLPMPKRLASPEVSSSSASTTRSGVARATTIASPGRRPGKDRVNSPPRRINTADSGAAPPRYISSEVKVSAGEQQSQQVAGQGSRAAVPAPEPAADQSITTEPDTPAPRKTTTEAATMTDLHFDIASTTQALATIGEESLRSLEHARQVEASKPDDSVPTPSTAVVKVVVAKLQDMKRLADELADMSLQAQSQLQQMQEQSSTASVEQLASPASTPRASHAGEAHPARNLDSVGTVATSIAVVPVHPSIRPHAQPGGAGGRGGGGGGAGVRPTSISIDSQRSRVLIPYPSAWTTSNKKHKGPAHQTSYSNMSVDLASLRTTNGNSPSASQMGTPKSGRSLNKLKGGSSGGGGESSVSKLLRRAMQHRSAHYPEQNGVTTTTTTGRAARSPAPPSRILTRIRTPLSSTPTPMASPATTIGSVTAYGSSTPRSRSVQLDGARGIGQAPVAESTSMPTGRHRAGAGAGAGTARPATPSSGVALGAAGMSGLPLWKKLRGAVRDVADRTL